MSSYLVKYDGDDKFYSNDMVGGEFCGLTQPIYWEEAKGRKAPPWYSRYGVHTGRGRIGWSCVERQPPQATWKNRGY